MSLDHAAALSHLRAADPVLVRVLDRVGPCRFAPRTDGTDFDALVRSIVFQQLSGKAAGTIHGRLMGLFGGCPPTAAEICAADPARLREAGLSRQKIAYLQDLAGQVASGRLDLGALGQQTDDAIMKVLTGIKGVGRWTAQMFLIFRLGRPDVLPELDLGIRKGVMQAHGLDKLPGAAEVKRLGACWTPHATIASWYLWRSLDIECPAI